MSTSIIQPVKLTDNAIEQLKSVMKNEGKENFGVRIAVKPGGCAGFSYDISLIDGPKQANDWITEQNGVKLYIDQASIPHLKGIEIDYVNSFKESGFKFNNPNATSTCGCGTSFS